VYFCSRFLHRATTKVLLMREMHFGVSDDDDVVVGTRQKSNGVNFE